MQSHTKSTDQTSLSTDETTADAVCEEAFRNQVTEVLSEEDTTLAANV